MANVIDGPPARIRLPDWEIRLFSFLSRARAEALAYGEFDCVCGLAAGAVEAQTGAQMATPHLGKYGSLRASYRYMRKQGWNSLEGLMDSFLRRAKPGDRHRGNIVLLESDLGEAFGVRTGAEALAFAETGLRAFRIPENIIEWSPL